MRRFYSTTVGAEDSLFDLDIEQSKHLRSVLRLRNGDEVSVFDGLGREYLCVVEAAGSGKFQSKLQVVKKIDARFPESDLELILAVALLKSDKFDLVIQKAVELGVSQMVPMVTKRCDVKTKNFESKLVRFERIVIESSKQCGRAKLMQISPPRDFEEFVRNSKGSKMIFAEYGGGVFAKIQPDKKITAVIGPEGGWESSEIDFARRNDFQIITLGGRILRAETAAITITSLLQHHFGDLN
jgi:16S rRNA (uracil1498-N3)-methyltransferase